MTCSMLEGLAGKHKEEITRVAQLVAEESQTSSLFATASSAGSSPL